MMTKTLGFINKVMTSLGLNYEFDEWKSDPVPKTYWVGEYNENGDEDDASNGATFILTGTTMGSRLILEQQREIIQNYIENGLTAILEDNSGIAVLYLNGFGIPSAVEGMKRVQVNLKIKEWKVN